VRIHSRTRFRCDQSCVEWTAMAKSVADKLVAHWASQKLVASPGALPQAVRTFEANHGVILPDDLRNYFLRHDGMDQDAKGFSFWPLARVRPAAEELAELSSTETPVELDGYFAFADYLVWCWAWAIRLTADPAGSNSVIMIGTGDGVPLKVASSFGEFVDLYLENSPRLTLQTP
jgi:cell wall assembly regulator SMI1